MSKISRLKNQTIAKALTAFPMLAEKAIEAAGPTVNFDDSPWTPVTKPLKEMRVAIVTTSGAHHTDQNPFDMSDETGDPSVRMIDASRPADSIMITHDYYDHKDADKDINIVFPIDRLREFADEGRIGEVAPTHYGLMGHLMGKHIDTLLNETSPGIVKRLKEEAVDAVLLTPG
ncbi:glycine/sarcosine/betaine reductase selenoprotein B family protein [Nitrospirota bacterium]